jgi:aquaporin Z
MNTKKLLAEFIGTFFLILFFVMIMVSGKAAGFEGLAIGAILIAMVYTNNAISGAHFNPAVTIAAFVRGLMTVNEMVAYLATQIVAAVFASFTAKSILQGIKHESINLPLSIDIIPSLLAEFFGTFALVYVILNVATSKRNQGNSYFGVAIGLTVMGTMYALGPASGGMFNPAITIGSCLAEIQTWDLAWVYFVGQILGAILATIAFKFMENELAE